LREQQTDGLPGDSAAAPTVAAVGVTPTRDPAVAGEQELGLYLNDELI
jgi:hypothetical protein